MSNATDTTLMLQYIKQHYKPMSTDVLYCSLDSVYFSTHSVLDLADKFYKNGGKHLFLDEVHKYATWSQEIKDVKKSCQNVILYLISRNT